MKHKKLLIPPEQIEKAILLIRGQRVLLDRDLAALYGVTTGNLNKAVQRNLDRFPADFMFQLTDDEAADLIFQIGRSKKPFITSPRRRRNRTGKSAFTSRKAACPTA